MDIPSHFVVVFVNLIMLIAYRDNGNIYSTGTTSSSFSSKNYECVGNETSIHDCPNNEKKNVLPPRGSFQGPNSVVKVRHIK